LQWLLMLAQQEPCYLLCRHIALEYTDIVHPFGQNSYLPVG
jgi:hypothetical protein